MPKRQFPIAANKSARAQAMAATSKAPRTTPKRMTRDILSSAPTNARTLGRAPAGNPAHHTGEGGRWLK